MATLGQELEPLHGHNYAVRARVDGDLTADRWVIDFSALKRYVREACEQLDHRFLLQRDSRVIEVSEVEGGWALRFGDRRYLFPAADVMALPLENTTAELLAEWLWGRAADGLRAGGHTLVRRLEIDVEEMPGQAGGYANSL